MIRNEKGVALGAAMVFMVAVGVGSFYMLKSSQETSVISAKEIKDIRARAEAKKIFSMAGFLVSNNLILCKSTPWGSGSTPKQCRWSGTKAEKTYKVEDFGFHNLRYESVPSVGDVLTLDLISKQEFGTKSDARIISRFPGSISLRLLDLNSDEALNKVVGEKSEVVKKIDDDHFIVKADLNLNLDNKENAHAIQAGAVFKRPIAIPQLTVLDSSCISLCNASRGEHAYPACRGPFTIDVNTKTDVVAVTENLGPGVLYDLDYERSVVFSTEVAGVSTPDAKSVDVPLNDYLEAGNKVEWVDQVECGSFIKNVTNQVVTTQYRTERGRGGDYTTTETTGSESERTVSQHSEPAGTLNYNIQVGSKLSKIEPFRLNTKVLVEDGAFKGKLDSTVTTEFVTKTVVHVVSPH